VESVNGRSDHLHAGDVFLGVLGDRESLAYLNGGVPADRREVGPGHRLHFL
jgi:hypothetical protein